MPIVAEGTQQTINLSADQAVLVSTAGLAYVDLVAGAPGSPHDSRRIDAGVPQQFGPYRVPAVLRVRAVQLAASHGDVSPGAYTWQALLALGTVMPGTEAIVTDIAANGRVKMYFDGERWRFYGLTTFLVDLTPMTGAAGTVAAEQVQKQWTAPAGLLMSLRWLSICALLYKSATSDNYFYGLRAGEGVTPLTDANVRGGGAASALITASNRSVPVETILAATSPTSLQVIARQQGSTGWNGAADGSLGIYPQVNEVPDMTLQPTVFSTTMRLSTGTDSGSSGVAHLMVFGA